MIAASNEKIAQAYVSYYCNGGDKSDYWAVEELSQIPISDPLRAWLIIQIINAIPIKDESWANLLYATLGCGPLEDIIVLHESFLTTILEAAAKDKILRRELSTIYESSLNQNTWHKIKNTLDAIPTKED